MGLFSRMANGWEVATASLKVLKEHKKLIVFPILSGISIALVIGSFAGVAFDAFHTHVIDTDRISNGTMYLAMLAFYLVNYTIVIFFNMALMYCAKVFFDGGDVSVGEGLRFSLSRIHYILLWTLFAATVGVLLRMIQDNLGWLGKILVGIVGVVWSVATFFIIPVLAYENLSPMDALKRSGDIVKQKWGEGITANFSVGLISFGVIILLAVVSMGISALANEQAGIILMVAGVLLVITISSALHSILISALYNQVNGSNNDHFTHLGDKLFIERR